MAFGFGNPTLDQYSAFWKAYWRMEATGASNRLDIVGTNHLVPSNSPGTRTGKNNNACDFASGSSQKLSVAHNTDLSPDTGIVVAGWTEMDDTGQNRTVFGKGVAGAGDRYYLYRDSGGTLHWGVSQSDSSEKTVNTSEQLTGSLHCFVAVASIGFVRLFINNVSVGTPIAYDNTMSVDAQPFLVGEAPWGAYWMDGGSDEMSFWRNIVFADLPAIVAFASAYWNGGAGIFPSSQSVLERTSAGLLLRTAGGVLERT